MRRTWVGVAALCALLAGCATPAAEPTSGPSAAPSTSAEVDLEALRLQYGLPDCPATDPAVEAVEGGLPRTQLQCLGSDVVVNLAGLERKPRLTGEGSRER